MRAAGGCEWFWTCSKYRNTEQKRSERKKKHERKEKRHTNALGIILFFILLLGAEQTERHAGKAFKRANTPRIEQKSNNNNRRKLES